MKAAGPQLKLSAGSWQDVQQPVGFLFSLAYIVLPLYHNFQECNSNDKLRLMSNKNYIT